MTARELAEKLLALDNPDVPVVSHCGQGGGAEELEYVRVKRRRELYMPSLPESDNYNVVVELS